MDGCSRITRSGSAPGKRHGFRHGACGIEDAYSSPHAPADEVIGLTAGQVEPNGIAKGIHQGMDFRAQSTT
jgi:hypothetical protein